MEANSLEDSIMGEAPLPVPVHAAPVEAQPEQDDSQATGSSSADPTSAAPAHVTENGQPQGDDEAEDASEEEEGGSEDEEEEEEGSSEEDDEEPKLKYQRLGASVSGILKTDAAKCILSSEKFLVLGTASGRLYILDLNGNEILSFHPHTQAINDLSLDASGDHVASCSNDGSVVITNLFTKEVTKHAYPRAIRSVALPGAYGGEKSNGMFAHGGAEGKFSIHTKGWFSAKDHVIHAGEGPIHAIKWRGELLAWANDTGVKVYDVSTSERITHIARADPNSPTPPPPASLFKCNLCWSRPDTLLIGWADSVKVGVVKSRGGPQRPGQQGGKLGSGPAQQSANRYVQIVAMFTTEYMICGIAPWGDHHLVLMAFLEDEEEAQEDSKTRSSNSRKRLDEPSAAAPTPASSPAAAASASSTQKAKPRGLSQRPELRIVTLTNEEVSADALPIVGYGDYNAQDYRLDYNPNGGAAMPLPPNLAAAVAAHVAKQPATIGVPQATMGPGASLAMTSSSSSSSAVAAPSPSGGPPSASLIAAATAHLEYLFYILAPADIVVAKPRDYDDHITWLLARQRYEEALHYAGTYARELKLHNAYDIGENFLKHLFEVERNYSKAAEYCTRLLGTSQSLWETYVYLFVKHDKLSYIARSIPTSNPTLSDTIYELVLNSYLADDHNSASDLASPAQEDTPRNVAHEQLLHLVRTWSHHLYHIKHLVENIKTKLALIEANHKDLTTTPAGRAKERAREVAERRRREALEAEQSSAAALSPESKKLVTPGSQPGSLAPGLYPPPPPLPAICSLVLLECLGELYLLNKQYALAFDVYLRLQRPDDLFRILTNYAHLLLEQKILDERLVPTLCRISLTATLDLLLAHLERVPVAAVMEQLKAAEKSSSSLLQSEDGQLATTAATFRVYQYEYLHAVFKKDHSAGARYHDEQVLLYAEFAPKELLHFLKNSNGYLLERALDSCEKHKLYREMVFLLKRMGNAPMALKLIIDELHDVKEAISFVEENGGRADGSSQEDGAGVDSSLWEELITRSLNNPAFLSDLLEHVGSHYVDLSKLIVRIPGELAIPNLKSKLITILNDCELQQSVIRGCTNILRNDCKSLVGRLYRRRKRAIKIPTGTRCAQCDVEVVQTQQFGGSGGSGTSSASASGILVFFCRHVLHRSCYESQQRAGERRKPQADHQCPRCTVHTAHAPAPAAQPRLVTQTSSSSTQMKRPLLAMPPHSTNSPSAGGAAVAAQRGAFHFAPSGGPSLPVARSILPQPSPSPVHSGGHARGSSSMNSTPTSASGMPSSGPRSIPLPTSSQVLPSASNSYSAARASSPMTPSSSVGVGSLPAHSGFAPTGSPSPQIKPQATFSRPSGRGSVAK